MVTLGPLVLLSNWSTPFAGNRWSQLTVYLILSQELSVKNTITDILTDRTGYWATNIMRVQTNIHSDDVWGPTVGPIVTDAKDLSTAGFHTKSALSDDSDQRIRCQHRVRSGSSPTGDHKQTQTVSTLLRVFS